MPTNRLPAFRVLFAREPTARAEAPGRVNLIGEHTDYNGGFVLPTAIPQRTRVELARRDDSRARIASADIPGGTELVEYLVGEEAPRRRWEDYVMGVTHVLREAGHLIGGFDARVESSVPIGSGLSSSAALEVSMLRALRAAFTLPVDDVELARLGRRAENDFVGAPVGIMDQMAASLADEGTALFIDTRTLQFERVALPAECDIVVVNSGLTHDHAGGEYRVRRSECEEASRRLGVRELRDLDASDLQRVESLPEPLHRRVRHVITENARVLSAVDAMRRGDLERLGSLFVASHTSMRDDFEVSLPEIDFMVASAREHADVFGARLTGGGFGGSIVALARRGAGIRAARHVVDRCMARYHIRPTVLVPVEPSGA